MAGSQTGGMGGDSHLARRKLTRLENGVKAACKASQQRRAGTAKRQNWWACGAYHGSVLTVRLLEKLGI